MFDVVKFCNEPKRKPNQVQKFNKKITVLFSQFITNYSKYKTETQLPQFFDNYAKKMHLIKFTVPLAYYKTLCSVLFLFFISFFFATIVGVLCYLK